MGSLAIPQPDYDVVVVGGGFSGIYMLHILRKFGFKTHLFEAGSFLGGIWYWNCYPGARVDTEVPCYQFTMPETWDTFDWKERYPGRDEIERYMRHVDKVWDLSKDISYKTRIEKVHWDEDSQLWKCQPKGESKVYHSRYVILSTGFASKLHIPDFKNIESFKGATYHTGTWPQSGVNLNGKRVAVIGTGASGVQLIQNAGHMASHLTVFQRTPNPALPMTNPLCTDARNKQLKDEYPESEKKIKSTFAGFNYQFAEGKSADMPQDEKMKMYEKLFHTGGLHFWLGTFQDVLFDQAANDEAYAFWRAKTLPRIHKEHMKELLAPSNPKDPFGTKRISLEQSYFEVYNLPTVDLISTDANPISTFTETGIQTADGVNHAFDIIVFATGFDAITGGITQLDLVGQNGITINEKWKNGTRSNFGMTIGGFPNLFYTYGPQAPTAFATGPSSAEAQGDWILALMRHMRREGIRTMQPTADAEAEWNAHVNDVGMKGLFKEAKSWYYGDNIPGKPREALNYMAGLPTYKQKCWESAENGWAGFVLAKS